MRWWVLTACLLGFIAIALYVHIPRDRRDAQDQQPIEENSSERFEVVGEGSPEPPKGFDKDVTADFESFRNELKNPSDAHAADSGKQRATNSPKKTPFIPTYRPDNGHVLQQQFSSGGHGVISISNGNTEDAVVSVADALTEEELFAVYIRAGHEFKKSDIPPGNYIVQFTLGRNWAASEQSFQQNATYSEFDKRVLFREIHEEDGLRYKEVQLTLNPVIEGNAKTSRIARDAWLRRHKRFVPAS
jgi:hypothetical protein